MDGGNVMKNVNEFIKWALKHAKNKPEGNYPYHVGGEPVGISVGNFWENGDSGSA